MRDLDVIDFELRCWLLYVAQSLSWARLRSGVSIVFAGDGRVDLNSDGSALAVWNHRINGQRRGGQASLGTRAPIPFPSPHLGQGGSAEAPSSAAQ
jgi:hypothetical protein